MIIKKDLKTYSKGKLHHYNSYLYHIQKNTDSVDLWIYSRIYFPPTTHDSQPRDHNSLSLEKVSITLHCPQSKLTSTFMYALDTKSLFLSSLTIMYLIKVRTVTLDLCFEVFCFSFRPEDLVWPKRFLPFSNYNNISNKRDYVNLKTFLTWNSCAGTFSLSVWECVGARLYFSVWKTHQIFCSSFSAQINHKTRNSKLHVIKVIRKYFILQFWGKWLTWEHRM